MIPDATMVFAISYYLKRSIPSPAESATRYIFKFGLLLLQYPGSEDGTWGFKNTFTQKIVEPALQPTNDATVVLAVSFSLEITLCLAIGLFKWRCRHAFTT
jgi:hypothetical protein